MTREAIALVVFIATACAPDPQSWRGFPLPPRVTVVKEIDEFLGTSKTLLLAADAPEQFDEIVAFYESQLPRGWERCPSSNIEWPAARGTLPARRVMWSNSDRRQFLWATTAESFAEDMVDDFEAAKLIAVGHDSNADTWDLFYRGFCAPRSIQLFSPMAVVSSKRWCASMPNDSAFDSVAWGSADERTRGGMLGDLLCRGLLLGLGQHEVIDLLGPPDTGDELAFSYQVYVVLDPPLPSKPEVAFECPENQAELRFDFTIEIPTEANAPFWIDYRCWADGT